MATEGHSGDDNDDDNNGCGDSLVEEFSRVLKISYCRGMQKDTRASTQLSETVHNHLLQRLYEDREVSRDEYIITYLSASDNTIREYSRPTVGTAYSMPIFIGIHLLDDMSCKSQAAISNSQMVDDDVGPPPTHRRKYRELYDTELTQLWISTHTTRSASVSCDTSNNGNRFTYVDLSGLEKDAVAPSVIIASEAGLSRAAIAEANTRALQRILSRVVESPFEIGGSACRMVGHTIRNFDDTLDWAPHVNVFNDVMLYRVDILSNDKWITPARRNLFLSEIRRALTPVNDRFFVVSGPLNNNLEYNFAFSTIYETHRGIEYVDKSSTLDDNDDDNESPVVNIHKSEVIAPSSVYVCKKWILLNEQLLAAEPPINYTWTEDQMLELRRSTSPLIIFVTLEWDNARGYTPSRLTPPHRIVVRWGYGTETYVSLPPPSPSTMDNDERMNDDNQENGDDGSTIIIDADTIVFTTIAAFVSFVDNNIRPNEELPTDAINSKAYSGGLRRHIIFYSYKDKITTNDDAATTTCAMTKWPLEQLLIWYTYDDKTALYSSFIGGRAGQQERKLASCICTDTTTNGWFGERMNITLPSSIVATRIICDWLDERENDWGGATICAERAWYELKNARYYADLARLLYGERWALYYPDVDEHISKYNRRRIGFELNNGSQPMRLGTDGPRGPEYRRHHRYYISERWYIGSPDAYKYYTNVGGDEGDESQWFKDAPNFRGCQIGAPSATRRARVMAVTNAATGKGGGVWNTSTPQRSIFDVLNNGNNNTNNNNRPKVEYNPNPGLLSLSDAFVPPTIKGPSSPRFYLYETNIAECVTKWVTKYYIRYGDARDRIGTMINIDSPSIDDRLDAAREHGLGKFDFGTSRRWVSAIYDPAYRPRVVLQQQRHNNNNNQMPDSSRYLLMAPFLDDAIQTDKNAAVDAQHGPSYYHLVIEPIDGLVAELYAKGFSDTALYVDTVWGSAARRGVLLLDQQLYGKGAMDCPSYAFLLCDIARLIIQTWIEEKLGALATFYDTRYILLPEPIISNAFNLTELIRRSNVWPCRKKDVSDDIVVAHDSIVATDNTILRITPVSGSAGATAMDTLLFTNSDNTGWSANIPSKTRGYAAPRCCYTINEQRVNSSGNGNLGRKLSTIHRLCECQYPKIWSALVIGGQVIKTVGMSEAVGMEYTFGVCVRIMFDTAVRATFNPPTIGDQFPQSSTRMGLRSSTRHHHNKNASINNDVDDSISDSGTEYLDQYFPWKTLFDTLYNDMCTRSWSVATSSVFRHIDNHYESNATNGMEPPLVDTSSNETTFLNPMSTTMNRIAQEANNNVDKQWLRFRSDFLYRRADLFYQRLALDIQEEYKRQSASERPEWVAVKPRLSKVLVNACITGNVVMTSATVAAKFETWQTDLSSLTGTFDETRHTRDFITHFVIFNYAGVLAALSQWYTIQVSVANVIERQLLLYFINKLYNQ